MPRSRVSPALLLTSLLLTLSGCATSQPKVQVDVAERRDFVPPPPDGYIACQQTLQVSPAVMIDSNGGYVSIGRHLLNVPPGSVSGQVTFQMVRPKADYVVVQVGPHQKKFDRSIYLTLSTAGCALPKDPGSLKVVLWTMNGWVDVARANIALTPGEDQRALEFTAAAQLDSLSNYALASGN